MSESIKTLETKRKELEVSLNQINSDIQALSVRRTDLQKEKEKLEKRIALMKKGGLIVSEHAMVRFMKRVMGLDVEQLKKDIVGHWKETIEKLGDGTYKNDKWQIVVQNGVVKTVKI